MIWRTKCLRSHPTIAYIRGTPARRGISVASPNIATLLQAPSTNGHGKVEAIGWVRTVRKQKHVTFLELGDGSTTDTLQVVLKPAQATGLSTGAAVAVQGIWRPAPASAKQARELDAHNVVINGPADETFPIQKKYHSPEYLRTIPHLRLRTAFNAILARMRSEVDYFVADYFRRRHFVRLQPPIITSSDCEGAGEVFEVSAQEEKGSSASGAGPLDRSQFFRGPKFLTVSSQLHLEAFVHEHPGVWTLSPTFRAEKSDTPRHVSEFWMLEAEMRTENLSDVMDVVEEMIRDTVARLSQSSIQQALEGAHDKASGSKQSSDRQIADRWASLRKKEWPRVSYTVALAELQAAERRGEAEFAVTPCDGEAFQLEHERWIAKHLGRDGPIFVTDYPKAIKPFYMLPSLHVASQDPATVACFDLLLPEVCEIVGGSLREHRWQDLQQAMALAGLVSSEDTGPGSLDWYLDLRKYGSVPHGGFGLGLDRLLCYLAGVDNIKDMVPWPRHYGRCDC